MDDYTYRLNGFTMGSGTPVRVTEVDGLFSLPDVVSSDSQRDDGDGEYSSGDETLAARVIQMDLALEAQGQPADDLYEQLQAATSVINRDVLLEIKRPGRPPRQLMVRVRKRDFSSTAMFARGLGVGSLELKALDPRIYSSEQHSLGKTVQSSLEATGGRTYPRRYPMKYRATPTTPSIGIVNNDGTYDAPGVIQIFGPITAPILENMTTGEVLQFKDTVSLTSGEVFTIDLDLKTIRSGTENRAYTLNRAVSNWFLLRSGSTKFRLRGADTARLGTFDIIWRDAWA